MSDRDENDHQSMPCGSVSSGLRRRWGKGGSKEIMERDREREVEMESVGRGREIEKGDETDGDAE